jgi:predicted phage terminase large subunit-like protein
VADVGACAELELRRRDKAAADIAGLPLLDFVPKVSRNFEAPVHLAPFAEQLDTIGDAELRIVCHSPPRHGKTELLLHLIVRCLMRNPEMLIGYGTYSSERACTKSRRALQIARLAGLELSSDKATEWNTPEGGAVYWLGMEGGWTALGMDLVAIDDPIKNRAEAESPAYRGRVHDVFTDAVYNRIEPGGSCVINMARWHPQDLAGTLIAEGWPYMRIPALCDSTDDPLGREIGAPLWPSRWPLEALEDRMRNEFTKASLYQGRPRPRGATLFRDAYYYDELPTDGYRVATGFDLAYTAKSQADYSVAIALAAIGDTVYVIDVERHQVDAARFGGIFKAFQARHGGRSRIYTGGGAEIAAAEYLARDFGIHANAQPALTDKFIRAQPVSTAWNEGNVLLPREAPWLAEFIDEVCSFTGVNDGHDDQVDALAAGFDEIAVSGPMEYHPVQTRRYDRTSRGWA